VIAGKSVIAGAKGYVKTHLLQAQRLYFDRFHGYSAGDVASALRALGITTGDTLLVHSSYDAFLGYAGKPTDIVAALKAAVGEDGALMMPTLPFTGTAVAYARSNPVFDVKRTPSCTGLLSEVFRRSPNVVRSVHPTHPVAVWGASARELVADHHQAATPCGRATPFTRLLERRGKILLLGTGIDVLTFYHALEEMLEARLPFSPFTSEVFHLQSRDYDGELVVTHTRLFEPAISKRRNLGKLAVQLKEDGKWRERRIARLAITALDAEDVRSTVSAMAERGVYCYD
jgi:aminoglycoside N3'-acetyltransferase